jgi:hypothetical protein
MRTTTYRKFLLLQGLTQTIGERKMSGKPNNPYPSTIRLDANEYSFEVAGGSVKPDLSGLLLHEPGEDHSIDTEPEVRVRIDTGPSEMKIVQALKLIIKSITTNHLSKPYRLIDEVRGCTMLMIEATEKVLEAAHTIKGIRERVHLRK